jgi:hypothetical protein
MSKPLTNLLLNNQPFLYIALMGDKYKIGVSRNPITRRITLEKDWGGFDSFSVYHSEKSNDIEKVLKDRVLFRERYYYNGESDNTGYTEVFRINSLSSALEYVVENGGVLFDISLFSDMKEELKVYRRVKKKANQLKLLEEAEAKGIANRKEADRLWHIERAESIKSDNKRLLDSLVKPVDPIIKPKPYFRSYKMVEMESAVVEMFVSGGGEYIKQHDIADRLWDNCITNVRGNGNGGRMAALTKACWKSNWLSLDGGKVYYHSEGDAPNI